MKKAIFVFMAVLAVFMLASCVTSNAPAGGEGNNSDNWWDNPPADTKDYHYETGFAEGSSLQIERDWAKANANAALAQWVKNTVQVVVTEYSSDAGELLKQGNNMQSLQAFERASQQVAEATLRGVTYKFYTRPNGGTFVLAALPIGSLAEEVNKKVDETFVENGAAKAATDKMHAMVDKYFSN